MYISFLKIFHYYFTKVFQLFIYFISKFEKYNKKLLKTYKLFMKLIIVKRKIKEQLGSKF